MLDRVPTVSQSAARVLSILNALSEAPELGVRDIARRLSLAPSVVQRLLHTLGEYGYVERATDGQKYRLGYRIFQVGQRYLQQTDLHAVSLPELRLMAERHQINAYLGVMRDESVVYLEALQSRGPIAITSSPGARAHLHSTAFGKALLAELDDGEVARLLGKEPFRRLTAKTKVRLKPLLQELRDVRRLGYAVSDEENIENVFAAGAAVRDSSGQAVASVSGAVPRHQLKKPDIERLCGIVIGAAERISRRLGGAPGRSSRVPHPNRQSR
ncbi:MAG TPA: IclR family transcriptional regulator [Sphingomicrobium sp.]|nr:IclR family transcriptional regulator [Sphingomicrobium sp.]